MSQLALAAAVFWVPFLPLFAMLFAYKYTDLLCYKKLHLLSSVKKILIFDLLIILASQILFPCISAIFYFGSALLFQVNPKPLGTYIYIVGALISTIVPLIIMHRKELKKMNHCSKKAAIRRRFLVTNIFSVCLADILYMNFYYSEYNNHSFLDGPILFFSECIITVIIFLLIKIATAIFFVVKNKRKLDLPTENQ